MNHKSSIPGPNSANFSKLMKTGPVMKKNSFFTSRPTAEPGTGQSILVTIILAIYNSADKRTASGR